MTTINGEKCILIKCPFPNCNQEFHYGGYVKGKHVCGGEFDSKTKRELRELFDRFINETNDLFSQFKLRQELLN